MKPAIRLPIDFTALESAFDTITMADPSFDPDPFAVFLHLETGAVIYSDDPEEIDALIDDETHLELPPDLFEDLGYGSLDEFIATLPAGPRRSELQRATRGKGAFRRFKNIVFGGGDVELKHLWSWFETRRQRERIVEWLRDENIEPVWDYDIFQPPAMPDKRPDLLRAVLKFTRAAHELPGVRRISLLGSLTTPKAIPKDVDLLIEIEDDTPLASLARLSRQLSGATMSTGDSCGADIFLCNPRHEYLGRICKWKQCAPGIRRACQATHCGRVEYLNDDLQNIRLEPAIVASPPLDLWPEVIARTDLPDDVRSILLDSLP